MWKGESANRQDFEQKVYKQGDVESDQEECRHPKLIAAARENVGGFPINVFGILDQKVFGDHTVIGGRRDGKLKAGVSNATAGEAISDLGLGVG